MEPITTEIFVLGAGPGGYAAAFYAADKGKKVTLVEQNPRLGGVCLNVGCIPSKALLHATEILREMKESAARGIALGEAEINLDKLRAWKDIDSRQARPRHQNARPASQRAGHPWPRPLRRLADAAGRNRRRTEVYPLRKSDHRRRLQTGHAQRVRSRQSARHDLDRGAWRFLTFRKIFWSSAAVTSAWSSARSMPLSAATSWSWKPCRRFLPASMPILPGR